jgi:transcriptional regulator with XRE-family HTH domain
MGSEKEDIRAFIKWAKKKVGGRNEIARIMGVTPNYVSIVERGERPLGRKSISKLAGHFGISYREILEKGERLRQGKISPSPLVELNTHLKTLMEQAHVVLTCGVTEAAEALASNIRYFYRAVRVEAKQELVMAKIGVIVDESEVDAKLGIITDSSLDPPTAVPPPAGSNKEKAM